ncbi:MAG TPA: hypothetical protein VN181_07130 [Thermoanaerobaculia bacterium]|nr:hypothetical protein [Thermoanaerobaculia bacterium]
MWVFDGEEWTNEGGGSESTSTKSETMTTLRIDEILVPELQVIEIVQTPKHTRIPPFPLP